MTPLRAHYDGKNFVPHDPVDLPKGAEVTIAVLTDNVEHPLRDLVDLADQQPVPNAPADWSEQHDHYIHGAPKR